MSPSIICYMLDISRSWQKETIAFLLNKKLHEASDTIPNGHIHVTTFIGDDGGMNAKLKFASETLELSETVDAYQGIMVPMTHGYHYFKFSKVLPVSSEIQEDESDEKILQCLSPPLHLQLMALSTQELESRLQNFPCEDIGSEPKTNKKKRRKVCRVHRHAVFAKQLGDKLGQKRPIQLLDGIPIAKELTDPLLAYLRQCQLWPPSSKQRKGVSAGNYLTIRKSHPPAQNTLWKLCKELINSIVPDATYTALAITKFFRGSPHVDKHDTTFQHVVALGEFEGGRLCADHVTDEVQINVHNRVGRIDGRNVHWVSGWKGERYSVVYYSTDKNDWTEPIDQSVHNSWMIEKIAETSRHK